MFLGKPEIMSVSESTMDSHISDDEFWRSISILTKNLHAVNRKISGVKIIEIHKVEDGIFNGNTFQPPTCVESFHTSLASAGVVTSKRSEDELYELFESGEHKEMGQWIIFTRNFYKQSSNSSYSLQVLDFREICFHNLRLLETSSDPRFSFTASLNNGELRIKPYTMTGENEALDKWFRYFLIPKLLKWAKSDDNQGKVKSLSLVDIEEYTKLYSDLKSKYGKEMVEKWTESTDPLKFVYEDVAIASYLILLWRKENHSPRNFLDMGCGNGLLVHILNSEGFMGYGVDIRKRKIWDIYPETTKLEEHTIIPNNYTAYNHVDWIIGNHSDELSPWIPVISAMSSYEIKYFLLPCCAYEFSGQKFQRRNCRKSVYNDFLDFVENISEKCQFETYIDRLKIPSTKRVAIIGLKRSYPMEEHQQICNDIDAFVRSEIEKTNTVQLKIRDKIEPVRNCTKIDRNIIDNIVRNIFEFILEERDSRKEKATKWDPGRSVSLQELAAFLSKDDLKSIKSECGGLKTLVKNKHDVFEVLGDKVKLRYPKRKDERPKSFQYKRRSCFFFQHHPDGCPLSSSDCSFVHERIKDS